jgi:YggT family protein
MGAALYVLIDLGLELLKWLIIIWVVLGLLIAFNVVNTRNQVVSTISRGLDQLFTPLVRPIRRILPSAGGLDLSPAVLMILVIVVQVFVNRALAPILLG